MLRILASSLLCLLPLTLVAADDSLADLRALGAQVSSSSTSQIVDVDLSRAWLSDADLKTLANIPTLESINLSYTKITDLGLEHLAPLKNVKTLNLYYAEAVTDNGIAHLKH